MLYRYSISHFICIPCVCIASITGSCLQSTSVGSEDPRSRPLPSHEAEETFSGTIVLNKDAAPVGAAGVGFRGRAVDRFRKPTTVIFSDELVTDTTSTMMVSLPPVRADWRFVNTVCFSSVVNTLL
jgi:hypothetical protein